MSLGADLVPVHAARAARIRRLLRLFLVATYVAVLLTEPPTEHLAVCWVIVAAYLVWTLGIGFLGSGDLRTQRYLWVALVVDVAALTLLTLISDLSADQSWAPYLLINGFFVIPIIAAAQLNPWMCAAVVGPTILVQLVTSILIRNVGAEPWSYVLLRTVLLSAVGLGAVLLSHLQRSRVRTIADLLADRTALLSDLVTVEQREQRDLAESLHDGALQYVLGARLELDDVATGDAVATERADAALQEAARLLRSTTTALHPAVLDAAGLPAALTDLAETVRARGRLTVTLEVQGWPDGLHTKQDGLLLSTARELVTNVVKHAEAHELRISLRRNDDEVVMVVSDDGRGMGQVDLDGRLAQGHLGLASRRVRVAAAGGTLVVEPGSPTGTSVEVRLPV
ncbi:ATP-binding protein [Branchiibius sp. NY16-3462-2]|uniref:sensor histidine kinase n=1 Tax=Branchiibius sp. NY16-3462-2 TaxID=1807500 RepID=UPI00079B3B2C|nr:ATP-binding protein [Branchiibius sp. NY16-3462-2]KYH45926.1 hypothetical protein AZH51_09625 [Branchiibius sp. NY16-3462-2]